MKLSDDQIEKAAETLWDSLAKKFPWDSPWSRVNPVIQDEYRQAVRDVVAALEVTRG